MTEIHRDAATGFARAADAYERGRPGYPPEAVTLLCTELGIEPGRRVLDLAAGTGKLTRLLVPSGADVVAVEPIPEMRATIPGALAGTAEAIPLGDASVDAVVAAQAFHWFASERALAEIHRVLRPDGRFGLVWNAWLRQTPWERQVEALLAATAGDTPQYARGRWRETLEASPFFSALEHRSFPFPQRSDRAGVVDRIASISFVAALPEFERASLLERVAALAPEGPLELASRTDVYWCRRL